MKRTLTPDEIRRERSRLGSEVRVEERQSKRIIQSLERELVELQGRCQHLRKSSYRFARCPDCGFVSDEPH